MFGIAASIAGNHSWWVAGLAGAAVSRCGTTPMSSIFTWVGDAATDRPKAR